MVQTILKRLSTLSRQAVHMNRRVMSVFVLIAVAAVIGITVVSSSKPAYSRSSPLPRSLAQSSIVDTLAGNKLCQTDRECKLAACDCHGNCPCSGSP